MSQGECLRKYVNLTCCSSLYLRSLTCRNLSGLAHMPTKHTLGNPVIYPHSILYFSVTLCVSCLYSLLNTNFRESLDCAHPTSTVFIIQVYLWEEGERKSKRSWLFPRETKSINNEREKKTSVREKRENVSRVQRGRRHYLSILECFH